MPGDASSIPPPKAILFDLFHTLVSVPPPAVSGDRTVPEILGVSADDWQRRYYDEDVLGRSLGLVTDAVEAMRRVTHGIDPSVSEERIIQAVESRRRRFTTGLTMIELAMIVALETLRAAGIRTALVSDAGADDVEAWEESPLRTRLDAVFFSFELGIRKPSPGIYLRALEAVGTRPEDAMFVGDGGSNEHWGARAVGMKTVLVTRLISLWWPSLVADRRMHADWEFEDVSEFVAALALPPWHG